MDGFDHYGTDRTVMDQYGHVGTDWTPSTNNPRTGTHSLEMVGGGGGATGISDTCVFRRPLLTPHTTVKLGYGFWIDRYPSSETGFQGAVAVVMAGWLTAGGHGNITLVMGTDGSIAAYDRWAWNEGLFFTYGTLLARSNPGVVHVAAWNHFECFVYGHASAGSVEVRIDGVTVLSLAAINSAHYGAQMTQVLISAGGLNGVGQFDIDDLVASDDVADNADFLGDMQVFTDFPDADGATQDWVPSAGALAYPMIDEAAPDEDGTYNEAQNAGDVMTLTFPGLPANLTEVAAVGFFHRSKKLGPGGSTILQTVVSGASSTPGYDGPVTTVYAGYLDVFETDPATTLPWLKASAAAAELDVERTA